MSIIINILLVIHVMVSLLIVLLVLMQRPKSEGLGAAFGGGMTDNLFGAQTTNVLQKATRWLGGTFLFLALTLSMLYSRQALAGAHTTIQQELTNAPAPKPVAEPKTDGTSAPAAIPSGSASPTASPTGSASPSAKPGDQGSLLQLQVPTPSSSTAPGSGITNPYSDTPKPGSTPPLLAPKSSGTTPAADKKKGNP